MVNIVYNTHRVYYNLPEGCVSVWDLLFSPSSDTHTAVFCPGLKKGMVLLEEKGHCCSRNYILRELLFAKLHFKGTFARGIIF